mmetsp:Transcript_21250/g.51353  ORF Transcript_21250/g.51353 Transcript_21250/m.51353 type:complete len:105 (-) Transcript_21250:413-727(-)
MYIYNIAFKLSTMVLLCAGIGGHELRGKLPTSTTASGDINDYRCSEAEDGEDSMPICLYPNPNPNEHQFCDGDGDCFNGLCDCEAGIELCEEKVNYCADPLRTD